MKCHDEKEKNTSCCCASVSDNNLQETELKFQEFMKLASNPGIVDSKQKELIIYALSVLSRCGPCVKIHYKKAVSMGISSEELDEVAWLSVAMGGAPVMTFYNEIRKDL